MLSEDAIFAWTPNGRFTLPADAAEVFGSEHPFLSALPEDLLKLLRHPDAGNLVIGGWSHNQRPVSFVGEKGAHAGVGPKETHAFVLLPSYVRASGIGSAPLRSLDLRDAALRYMGRATASHGARATPPTRRVRVVTYNVHSCMGLDERLSPRASRVCWHTAKPISSHCKRLMFIAHAVATSIKPKRSPHDWACT